MKNHLLVLAGALAGGILGHVACVWMAHQGFYAMVLPGGLAGLGAGIFRSRSLTVHIACGVWALVAGLVTEWHLAPFLADGSFGYFLTHVGSLQPVTILMIAAGALIGFWIPFQRGREHK
jgi:hypothetical protein